MPDTAGQHVPPIHTAPAIDTKAFRNALGTFVTGVTIITTLDQDGQPAGLTANSFNSVSLDPPMVLWSLALDSTSLNAFRHAAWWAVHVLAAGQETLSNQFARRDADKFHGVQTTPGPGGIPLLDGSAARFVCRAAFEYEGGDHAIFLGAVEDFEQSGHPPLVYHKGCYAGIVAQPKLRTGNAPEASLATLEHQGLVGSAGDGTKHLTASGRDLTAGLLALAAQRSMPSDDLSVLGRLLAQLA